MSALNSFTDEAVRDERVVALAARIRYRIDPANPYPGNFTGHVRARLADGRIVEERQPHLRGGAHEPLTRGDIKKKFMHDFRHGGWDDVRALRTLTLLRTLYDGGVDLDALRR